MADELQGRLEEAAKHFAAKNYDGCIRVLQTCPAEDPKVRHNLAIADFAKQGGNHRATLQQLQLPPLPAPGQPLEFRYAGQELAYINRATLLLHSGHLEEARATLVAIAGVSDKLAPKLRPRVAMLLHIATRRGKTAADTHAAELVTPLLSDRAAMQADPLLSSLVPVAFADTSGLHGWYAASPKAAAEQSLYFNNLGVEAFGDGKLEIAALYLAKAASAVQEMPSPCPMLEDTVLYNNGLCLLARGDASGATSALSAVQRTMSGSPLLWVRVGQALYLKHATLSKAAAKEAAAKADSVRGASLATGAVPSFMPTTPALRIMCSSEVPPSADAAATLVSAIRAFAAAKALLLEPAESLTEAAKRLQAAGSRSGVTLLGTVLQYTAALELARGNYPVAMQAANDFFQMQAEAPSVLSQRAMACMVCYAVEALCALNKPSQAFNVLQSVDLGELVAAEGAQREDTEALLVNLCIVHILKGAWSKAYSLANAVLPKLQAPHAQLLLMYLELAQGSTAKSREIADKPSAKAP